MAVQDVPDLLAGLFPPPDAAKALRLSTITLAKWRSAGTGPRWCKIGGKVYYREDDLRAWVMAQAEAPAAPRSSAGINR
ncbi:helix-turn-helix domain-containing protein [Jiella sonneratiae]|uniref:Helix-turn-helix domain-containing protein n=1 Tax=Jiella sonneratiae TaxID=2816856 RepID=A0ABS3J4C8_9HYPH|nr:helix-turn-helix domain-containing protein [Jiella sonneratiae]